MKKFLAVLFTAVALAGMVELVGCSSEETTPTPVKKVKKAAPTTKAAPAPTTAPATK